MAEYEFVTLGIVILAPRFDTLVIRKERKRVLRDSEASRATPYRKCKGGQGRTQELEWKGQVDH